MDELVFFDSNNYYDLDLAKQDLYEMDEYGEYQSPDDVSDDDAYRRLSELEEIDWDDTKILMEDSSNPNERVIGFGSLGLWDGNYHGGFVTDNIDNAIYNCLGRDCEPDRVYMEDGNLHFTVKHHDGRNDWILRNLTSAGEDFLNDWDYAYGDHELANLSEGEIMSRIISSDEYSTPIILPW